MNILGLTAAYPFRQAPQADVPAHDSVVVEECGYAFDVIFA